MDCGRKSTEKTQHGGEEPPALLKPSFIFACSFSDTLPQSFKKSLLLLKLELGF